MVGLCKSEVGRGLFCLGLQGSGCLHLGAYDFVTELVAEVHQNLFIFLILH